MLSFSSPGSPKIRQGLRIRSLAAAITCRNHATVLLSQCCNLGLMLEHWVERGVSCCWVMLRNQPPLTLRLCVLSYATMR